MGNKLSLYQVLLCIIIFNLKMPVSTNVYQGQQQQMGCFDKVKMGFMMGACVGMGTGFLFGGFTCLRVGLRGRELMKGMGQTMFQSAGTFGTFMAIGMGIRC